MIQCLVEFIQRQTLEGVNSAHHLGRFRFAGILLNGRVIRLVAKRTLRGYRMRQFQFAAVVVKQMVDLQFVDNCAYRCRVLA